jgi:hypothetical protein
MDSLARSLAERDKSRASSRLSMKANSAERQIGAAPTTGAAKLKQAVSNKPNMGCGPIVQPGFEPSAVSFPTRPIGWRGYEALKAKLQTAQAAFEP